MGVILNKSYFPTGSRFKEYSVERVKNLRLIFDDFFPGSNQVCELCGQVCKSYYAKHMYEKHGIGKKSVKDSRRFMCAQCPREFMTKKSLDSHVSLVHEGKVGRYSCPFNCGKTFNYQSGIASHVVNMHSDHYQYSCSVCGKKFKVFFSQDFF